MPPPGGELAGTVTTTWPDGELVDVARRLRSAGAWLIAAVVLTVGCGPLVSMSGRSINVGQLLGAIVLLVSARRLPLDAVRGRAGLGVALQAAAAVIAATAIAQAVHWTAVAVVVTGVAMTAVVVLGAAAGTHLSRRVGADDAVRWWRLATVIACAEAAVVLVVAVVDAIVGIDGFAVEQAATPVVDGVGLAVAAVVALLSFGALVVPVVLGGVALGVRTKRIVGAADAHTV